jgi:preprotein translocase subunit SecD
MLDYPRWKAAAILLTTLVVSLMAVPSFLSAATFESLPKWAQRKVELGYDLQGGTRLVLAVDTKAVRQEETQRLRDEARVILREARIATDAGVQVRDETVMVSIRDASTLERAVSKLRETGHIVDSDGLHIRLRISESDFAGYIQTRRRASMSLIERRVQNVQVPASIESWGADRIVVEIRGPFDPYHMRH